MRDRASSESIAANSPPGTPTCAATDTAAATAAPMARNEHAVDQAELLGRFEGETELLQEVTAIFLSERPPRSERLREAVRRKDCELLALAAHSFAGCLSMFAAPHATRLARELERLAHSGDLVDSLVIYDALEDELDRVARELVIIADHAGRRGLNESPGPFRVGF